MDKDKACEQSVAKRIGLTESAMSDLLFNTLVAFSIMIVVAIIGATIVLGVYAHYQRTARLIESGHVLRPDPNNPNQVIWIKEDPKTEKKED